MPSFNLAGKKQHQGRSSLPPGLTPLGKLGQAMNFQELKASSPTMLVTMDHRAVLVAAWAALQQGVFKEEALLLRLDAHPDMGERPRPWEYEKSLLTDLDSVSAIVNATRLDDGGWVIPALQWGFAKNVYSAFVHQYHRFPGDCSPYKDHLGTLHTLYTSSGCQEVLARFQHAVDCEPNRPRWVDVDLDFATTRLQNGNPRPWTNAEWEEQFPPEALQQFAAFAQSANLITISLEPWFCGGVEACGKIAREFQARLSPYTTAFHGLA